ncbi:hypothetical protein AY601_3363 [Pedobacter cryoconitis]|uniref:TOD1/MUCI70 glycosyltransferase-like domain-containing protein n=1 Tax=Pedobacter cryoconitis TaxID=188932 RepID=A0A127VGB6_9SPHI|nr:glycosyltransferase domain-containing protein [Pedobacter cryoconitis]AMQ00231.1 hypothetical protein AY601_3363 [Pedobacter cryoconitis]
MLLITAAFGENIKELSIETTLSNQDYSFYQACYNDTNIHSRVNSLHPRLKGKIPKMMCWLQAPGFDYYIWVDSTFTILDGFVDNMMEFVDEDYDLFLFAHTKRNSIKDELDYINLKMSQGVKYINDRYDGELINEQVQLYLSDETFIDNSLFAGGCFMYSNRLIQNRDYNLMTDWLLHNTLYSIQDQLSMPYLIHKHQIKYKVYPHILMKNNFLVHDFGMFF